MRLRYRLCINVPMGKVMLVVIYICPRYCLVLSHFWISLTTANQYCGGDVCVCEMGTYFVDRIFVLVFYFQHCCWHQLLCVCYRNPLVSIRFNSDTIRGSIKRTIQSTGKKRGKRKMFIIRRGLGTGYCYWVVGGGCRMVHVVDGWEFRNIRQNLNLYRGIMWGRIGVVQCDDIMKIITYSLTKPCYVPHTSSDRSRHFVYHSPSLFYYWLLLVVVLSTIPFPDDGRNTGCKSLWNSDTTSLPSP